MKLVRKENKMNIRDIEIDKINLKVNFVLDDNTVIENCFLNSEHLSNTTLTNIFEDLAKVDLSKFKKENKND